MFSIGIRKDLVMKNLIWIFIAALYTGHFHMFGFLLAYESYFLRKFTFDDANITCETSYFKAITLLTCAAHCVKVETCVAIIHNNEDKKCCLLTKQLPLPNDVQQEGKGTYEYFEKSAHQLVLDCKDGWEEQADSSYCFVTEKANWSAAKETCSLMASHLVAIETEAENEWLFTRLEYYYDIERDSGDQWWSGGTDSASEGTFYWQHSKQGLDFTYWNPGDPSGGTAENCALLLFLDKWQDFPCTTEANFICEK